MATDYEVGYGRPPKEHRFKKGQSGNPNGRPKKVDPPERTLLDIIADVRKEKHEIGGKMYTFDELMIRSMMSKVAKAEPRAVKQYTDLLKQLGLLERKPEQRLGGVLVVPGMSASDEEWEREWSGSQAKFRGDDPEGLARLYEQTEALLRSKT